MQYIPFFHDWKGNSAEIYWINSRTTGEAYFFFDEETLIDYINETGFLVGESFEASACAIGMD